MPTPDSSFEDSVDRILKRLDAVQPALQQLQKSMCRLMASADRFHQEAKGLEQAVNILKQQVA